MIHQVELVLTPLDASKPEKFKEYISRSIKTDISKILYFRLIKRSIDARKPEIKVLLKFSVVIEEDGYKPEKIEFYPKDVSHSPEVHIIGAGPAGLFAALKLIELGLKPIIFESGNNVHQRKVDIANMIKNHQVNSDSNYCFGEGGAGTFSDGKLYTRSSKRGNINRILELLFLHGAPEEVLFEAHPHIGTDKLPGIIENIRNTIIKAGGEVHFNSKVEGINVKDNAVNELILSSGEKIKVKFIVLGTGHSARDVYSMLQRNKIQLEPKGFAMGVRIEHSQEVIDRIQYHGKSRGELLPAATYNLVQQVNGRGVYSFCMCPGGFIVPASTSAEEIVVNGMSPAKRNSPFANSGFVTEIRTDDLTEYNKYGVMAGLEFQHSLEKLAFENGGGGLIAPAQGLLDFTQNKATKSLPKTSYIPGIISSEMHRWLPSSMKENISKALIQFGQKMKGFLTNDAIMVGVESRTSSPIRIPRDKETLEHIAIKGLFPCGEGAGYAGGIVSSAMDGMNVAEKIMMKYKI